MYNKVSNNVHSPSKVLSSLLLNNSIRLVSLLIWCLVSSYVIRGVDSKYSSGTALLTGTNSESLITKFAIPTNSNAKYDMTIQIPASKGMYTDERFLKLHFFIDDDWWSQVVKAPTCSQKIQYASMSHPVTFDLVRMNTPEARPLKLKEDSWVANIQNVNIHTFQYDRITYWYITLDDCSLEQTQHSIQDVPQMSYTFTIQNQYSNGTYSHFSADEMGITKLHVIQLLVSTSLLVWTFYKIAKSIGGSVHIALLTVALAIICDVLSSICELIHDSWFALDGVGSYSFDALASHLEAQCDALIATVLILVGSGWTLPTDMVITDSKNNMSMMGTNPFIQRIILGFRSPITAFSEFFQTGNPAVILVLTIFILHAILAQWGRTYDDDFDSYHSLQHLSGTILMIFRMLLGIAFLVGISSVRNSNMCPRNLVTFLTKFMLVGVSWFISLPFVSFFVTSSLPYRWHHQALMIGSALVQSSSLASLVWLFTADSSASVYHQLSKVQNASTSLNESTMSYTSSNGSADVKQSMKSIFRLGKTKIRLD